MSQFATTTPHAGARTIALTNHALVVAVSVLLFLPSALFAASLRTAPALVTLVGCCGGMALVAAGRSARDGVLSAPIDVGRLLPCWLCALALLILGGEMHVFYTTWDWLTRDAVLADLIRHGLSSGYRIDDADYLLRAPLGMYMTPAAVGHAFGLVAGHVALLGQNALFLGVIFYFLITIGAGWGHLAILLLFAGVSILGAAMRIAGTPPQTVPFWLLKGLDSWHPLFQYSGTLVQFFWVPNHALPGWWLATLILLQTRRQTDVATIGVSVAGALLWSPLCIVGAVPWLLYCAIRWPRAVILSGRTWCGVAAAGCFVPILVYLVSAASSIDGGNPLTMPDFAFWYALFIAVQLPVLVFLAVARNRIAPEDRALVVICALELLVLPFFRFGPNNDLVMRGSIVALTVVAFAFGKVLVEATALRAPIAFAGWLLVLCGTPSALVEIGRAVLTPRYAISDCSLMEASRALGETAVPSNYVTPVAAMPAWLIDSTHVNFETVQRTACWPEQSAPRYLGYKQKPATGPAEPVSSPNQASTI